MGRDDASIDLLRALSNMNGAKVRQANFQDDIITLVAGSQKLEDNLTSVVKGKLGPYEWDCQVISLRE